MISKASATESFVYLTLPGPTSAVAAGKFVLSQNARNDALGQFVYRGKYPDDPRAVEIDPVELKLFKRTYETARLSGLFGALRNAGPDYWGRRVIEKHAGETAIFFAAGTLIKCREGISRLQSDHVLILRATSKQQAKIPSRKTKARTILMTGEILHERAPSRGGYR